MPVIFVLAASLERSCYTLDSTYKDAMRVFEHDCGDLCLFEHIFS